jgi:hypothetical protein
MMSMDRRPRVRTWHGRWLIGDTARQPTQGINFLGALALLFIALKLTHTIDWSWWWITAPLWMPLAFALGLVATVLGLVAVSHLVDRR